MAVQQRTHYDTLGVPTSASADQIKAAYRTLMRKHHPDIAGPAGAAMTLRLNDAISELGSPISRTAYDRSIAPPPEPPPLREPAMAQPQRSSPPPRDRTPAAEDTYRPLDDEIPPAIPLLQRRSFKAWLITAGTGMFLLLGSTLFFWWRAFIADPTPGALAGAPLLLAGLALFATLSEQGRLWPWVVLGTILVIAPLSLVSAGILGLILGGGAFRLAMQPLRNHWRTRPLNRR